jgi:putative copper export protein
MNRFRLTDPGLAGDRRSMARLRAAILAEAALIAAILGLVALWRSL